MYHESVATTINKLESAVRKTGLYNTGKCVNISLAFLGHETPQYKHLLDCWNYVLRSH